METKNDDYEALKQFVLDSGCLEVLSEWTDKVNIFEILGMERTEIRHSNMLAWLLDPSANHDLGDEILKLFLKHASEYSFGDDEIFDILLKDHGEFVVLREFQHIDILAVSDTEKMLLCIENKVDTGEHDNQLKRYSDALDKLYPNYTKYYIYLTPHGDDASEADYWAAMSYQDVVDIIESVVKHKTLSPEVDFIIRNYMDVVRRNIVGDDKLAKICAEIYKKHQRAIDLIIENRPDKSYELSEIFQKWCAKKAEEGKIIFDPENSNRTFTRFKTKTMSEIFPDSNETLSGWKTPNNYFYEIRNSNGEEYYIKLSFSSENLSEDLRKKCEILNKYFPAKSKKPNWIWRSNFKTPHSKITEESDETEIFKKLDTKLNAVFEFEKRAQEIFNTK